MKRMLWRLQRQKNDTQKYLLQSVRPLLTHRKPESTRGLGMLSRLGVSSSRTSSMMLIGLLGTRLTSRLLERGPRPHMNGSMACPKRRRGKLSWLRTSGIERGLPSNNMWCTYFHCKHFSMFHDKTL